MRSLIPQIKGSRRGRNTLAAGCGTTAVVSLLAAFGYLAWARSLPPPEVDQRVLPSPNGYDACAAATANLPNSRAFTDPWSADPRVLCRDLAPARPNLAALRVALRLPYLSPAGDPVRDTSDRFVRNARHRQMCRVLAAEACLELAENRPGAAMQRSLDAIELGTKVGRGGTLIDNLVGGACASMGRGAAARCIPWLTAEEARVAGRRLDTIFMQLPTSSEVIAEERRVELAMTRLVLAEPTPKFAVPASRTDPAAWWNAIKEQALYLLYPRPWAYRRVEQYWRTLATEMRRPYSRQSLPRPFLFEDDPLLGEMDMGPELFRLSLARLQLRFLLLRTELALQEFRARHGDYPATLGVLVPEELASVPIDPFSDLPLRYRRQGTGYVVYSVGPDQKDDGGKCITGSVEPDTKGDLVAGPLLTPR